MRLRLFFGMWAVIALVVALTVVINEYVNRGSDASDQVVSGPDGEPADGGDPTSTTAPGSTLVPAAGQLHVTGLVTAVRIEGAVLEPREVPTPLTISSDRGFGNGADLTGVTVDGNPSTVVWDGGRPFVLSDGGALILDPGIVDIGPDGLRFVLGGSNHRFRPGTYRLDTPVAVGTQGIATPREGISFDATDGSILEARGDAAIALSPDRSHHLIGPGVVHLEGTFEVTDSAGTRSGTVVDLAQGPFDITFDAEADGWRVTAVLQGDTTVT